MRTEPVAGESVDPGATVTIFLSTGQVLVPDFVGTAATRAAAEQALIDLGLVPVVEEEESNAAPGTVIGQSRGPGPVPQQISVTITVAIARPVELVTVPDVIGMTSSEASAALGAAGLNAAFGPDEPSTEPDQRVARTDPDTGTEVEAGSTVTIFLSNGTPPAP